MTSANGVRILRVWDEETETRKETQMSATKALMTDMNLNHDLTNAVLSALKGGMCKEEVLAAVQRLAELLDNSDDD